MLFSDLYSKIQGGQNVFDIRIIGPSVLGVIITVIYFCVFSSYALGKYNAKVLEAFETRSAEIVSTMRIDSPNELFQVMESWNDIMQKL